VGQCARPLGQPGQLASDEARDLLGPERGQPVRGLLSGRGAVSGELAEKYPQQERVARRDRVAGVRERAAGPRQLLAHERLGGLRAKGPRPHRWVGGRGEQLCE